MFELIESCPERRTGMGWTGRIVSTLIHLFLVSAAVAATREVVTAVGPTIFERPTTWHAPHPAPTGGVIASPSVPVYDPVDVPTQIPEPGPVTIEAPPAWDPVAVPGCLTCTEAGLNPLSDPGTIATGGNAVHEALAVDEQPRLLWHPSPQYPPVLRQAGIEGRVLVETVLDTLGRAEPALARVVSSPHPMFDAEALAVVTASRYQPAKVRGQAVRVRIRVPISFEIRR